MELYPAKISERALPGNTAKSTTSEGNSVRRSDSRARENNSRRKKQFNSLPTDRRALLSERLEQAKVTSAPPRKTFRFFFPPDQSLSVYCFRL